MLLCYVSEELTNESGSKVVKKILCSVKEGAEEYFVNQLSTDPSIFLKLVNDGFPLKYGITPDNVPLVFCDYTDDSRFMNITSIYKQFRQLLIAKGWDTFPKDIAQQLLNKLKGIGISSEDGIFYLTTILAMHSHLKESINSGMDVRTDLFDQDFSGNTAKIVNSLKREMVNPFTKISEAEDVTLYQENCTDKLFIHLPLPHELNDDDISMESLIPDLTEVCKPYKKFNVKDITLYKDIGSPFRESDYPLVEGNSDNNELGIQENEADFYQALIDWVSYNMKVEYGNDIDVSSSNPYLDSVSLEFLTELLDALYMYHWKQNPNIPEINEDYDEDSPNVASKYLFRANEEEASAFRQGFTEVSETRIRINALDKLKNFVKNASLQIGYRAYIEAIIKLARWGERKCSGIAFDDYSKVFYLGVNQEKERLGNIEDYEPVKKDGFEYSVSCMLYDNTLFMDKKYLGKLGYSGNRLIAPVGVCAIKTMTNKKTGKSIDIFVNFSMLDVVQMFVEGKPILSGISFDGNSFVADPISDDDSITVAKMLKSSSVTDDIVQDHFYRSDNLIKLYLDFGAIQGNVAVKPNQLSIVVDKAQSVDISNDFTRCHVKSKIDFDNKRASRELRGSATSILNSNIASVILPVFIKASSQYTTGMSFTDVLNLYYSVMKDMGYKSEADFLEKEESQKSLASMNVFGDDGAKEPAKSEPEVKEVKPEIKPEIKPEPKPEPAAGVVESNKTVSNRFSMVMDVPKDCKYWEITDRNGIVVGGLGCFNQIMPGRNDAVRKYVLVQKSSMAGKAVAESVVFSKLLPMFMQNLLVVESNRPEMLKVFFDSSETLKYYRDLLNTLIKEGRL